MRVKFAKDDDGKIWLSYVKDLHCKKIKFDYERHLIMKEVQNINKQAKEQLITELNHHLDTGKSAKTVYSIYKVMNKHYTDIKDSAGITEWLEKDSLADEEDLITEEMYK